MLQFIFFYVFSVIICIIEITHSLSCFTNTMHNDFFKLKESYTLQSFYFDSLISSNNSTININEMTCILIKNQIPFVLDELSQLILTATSAFIKENASKYIFESSGSIYLTNITILQNLKNDLKLNSMIFPMLDLTKRGSVIYSQTSFCSLSIRQDFLSPFLCSSTISSFTIFNCNFANISFCSTSRNYCRNFKRITNSFSKSNVEQTSFRSVDDAIYETLFLGVRKDCNYYNEQRTFSLKNCTVACCQRIQSNFFQPSIINNENHQRIIGFQQIANYSFVDSSFIELRANGQSFSISPETCGGAIFISFPSVTFSTKLATNFEGSFISNAITKESVSSTENLLSKLKQGNSLSIYLKNCSFIECHAFLSGGAVIINGPGECSVQGCLFENCSTTGKQEIVNTGAISFNLVDSIAASGSQFSNCATYGHCGGLYVMLLHVMENSKFCDEHIQVKKNYEKDNIHTQLSFSTNSSFQNLSSEDSQNEHFIENEQPHVVLNNLEFFRCKSENGWGGGCIVCCFNKNDCTVLSDCSFSFCSGHEIVGCLSLSFISSIACSTVNYCLFANNTCEDEDFSDIVGCDAMVIDGEKVFGGKSIFSDCLSTRKSKRCVLRYGISLFLQRDEWIPRGMKTVYVREKERLMEDRSINSFDEEASVGCGITKESPCNLLSEGIQQCGISLPCTLIALQGSIRGDDSLGDLSNQLSIIGAGKELSSIYPRLARGGTFFIHIDSNAALISDISIVYDPSMNSNVDGSLFFINSVDTYDESVATHFSSQYSSADSSQLQRSFTFVKPHSSKTTSELAKSRIHTSLDKSSFTSPQFKSGCNVPLHSTPNRLSTDKFAFILSNVSILTPSDINVSLRNPLFLVISGSISANCLKLSSFISSDSALFSMSPPHSEIANAYNIHFIFANSEIEAYSGSTKPVISLKESEDFSNDPQTELEFINSTFSDCRAAQSSFGGICCVRICSNEKLSVIDCQCHNCVCSETVGKGGCFCVITPSQGENFDLLHIFFKRLSVKGNVAKYGKNIFVQCNSLERQLTASMFRINFDGEEVDWSNSIVGSDSTNAFLDIYELQIKNFYSDTSVCVDGKLGKEVANCGTEIIPCKTLSNGLTHLQMKNIVSNDESLCANLKSPACSPEHFSSRASEADICHLSIMNSVSIGSEITILNAELEGSGANPELLLDAVCVSENVDDGVICCGGITTLKSFTVLEKESFESDRDSIFSEFDSTLTFSSMKINLFISNRLSLLLKMNSGKAFLNQVFIETFFKIGPVIDCYDIKNLEIHNCTFNMKGTMFPILRIKNNVEVPFPQFLNVTKTNFATGLSSASFYTSHIVVEVKDTEKYYRSTSNRKMSVLIQHSNFSSPTLKSCVSLQCCNISMKSVNFSHSLNDSADIYNANFIDVADISNSHMQKTMIDYQSCISSIKSCQWTEAFLMLENSEGKIEEISFSGANFTQIQDLGGICIKAGDIALNSVKFISLNSSLTEYQSMRLHMSCGSAAKLQLTDIQADIPSSQNCLWISNVDCSISGPAVTPGISVFFLPVISSVTFVALENRLRFTVNGEMLIPCGLSLELLFEADNISKIESVADVTTANDHQLIFYTNNSIFNDSPPNESISLRMAVKTDIMNGISYSSPFVLKEKKYDPNNPVSPRNRRDGIIVLSILLPIFFLKICASLFLFFAYRRRRIKKSKEMFQKKVQEIFIAQQNAENYSSNKKKQKAYEISSNDSESNSFLLPADEQEPFFEDD